MSRIMKKINPEKPPLQPAQAVQRIAAVIGTAPNRYLLVDTAAQTLSVIEKNTAVKKYPVSTSRYGVGNRENSFMTPPGVHRVSEKFGHNAPAGRIFRDRIDTGEDFRPGDPADCLVLTRILWLEGLEDGVNRGTGIDSHERYIYIHGTSNEEAIGRPASHGCVCMRNSEVVELFDSVEEGTIVLID
jgi:lipoprotein-anchoring transpeptidase ErfK/SrfK